MFDRIGSAGIVTLVNWTMAADGNRYLYFWSKDWQIVTDKDVPIEGFHSTERWQLIAKVDGKVACLIPGCQVKAWMRCDGAPRKLSPEGSACYIFGE